MKKLKIFAVLILSVFFLSAQSNTEDEKNVTISKSVKKYHFVTGNTQNPVQIKEDTRKTYYCTSYRTDVPVVEFYNDIEIIDDVSAYIDGSKRNGVTPKYEYYNADGIFYSDAHVCYFQLPLLKKGSSSEVVFKKTTLDPHYFTQIYFMDELPVEDQEISITVPSWMKIEIKEFNFDKYAIQKKTTTTGDGTVYTYSMKNIPAGKRETSSPGPTYHVPHILVLCKSAQPANVKYTYFNSLKEQYAWYKKLLEQVGNDEKFIKEKTEEILKGITTDEDKVKKLYQWVQDNIRYIAFENGIAGFKPEKAQDVLRKKYGDCKGMANLLTEMLRSTGLDARRCWIGTKHINYDYSTPSLAVDNHMICAWLKNGKLVFLDATEKYIGFGEVAERIQGRQTLIENGNSYLLERVPVATSAQNTVTEIRKLAIDGNNLKGRVVQTWKGENKEWLLSSLNNIKQDKQENALKQFLSEGKDRFEISNMKIYNLSDYNADLKIEYDVNWKDALTVFDKETYFEVDNRRNLEGSKIDTVKRKLAYWFPFKNNMIVETEISIPAGKTLNTLPEKLSVTGPGYSFLASYANKAGSLSYKCEITLQQAELKPENFLRWNQDIDRLTEFYNQQITLTQKN